MKKFFQIRPTKTVLSIIMTIIIGFLIGIFSTNTLPKTVYEIDEEKKSYVQIFLNSFSLNYWYFFVLWFYAILEGIIILPTLIYLANKSIKFSINGRRTFNDTGQKYFNVLVRVTIVIMIYALLTCFKMTFLEVQ